MKLYSNKQKRYVERQVHFGIGKSCRTACGLVLYSRHVMVSLYSNNDGAIITDDMDRVTCKRCLATRDLRLRKLIKIESIVPGIFDRDTLCGEEWLLKNALNISQQKIDSQKLTFNYNNNEINLFNNMISKDRKQIIKDLMVVG